MASRLGWGINIFSTPLPLTRSQTRVSSTIVPLLTVHVIFLVLEREMDLLVEEAAEESISDVSSKRRDTDVFELGFIHLVLKFSKLSEIMV